MADTICKWCDREISEPDNEHPYWHDSDKFLAMTCSGTPNRRHEPAEPSTEGTQAAQPRFGFFRCLSCGFNGTISTDEIAKHRAQCSHGPTVPMSQAEWEARGEPAPVAQVDAGKCASIDRTKSYSIPADSHHSCDFWQGFALALASVNRSFDEPTIVKSVMNGFGVTDRLLKQANVENYDLKEIRKCMK